MRHASVRPAPRLRRSRWPDIRPLAASVIALALFPLPAAASQPPPDDAHASTESIVEVGRVSLPIPDHLGHSAEVWHWDEGDLGYVLQKGTPGISASASNHGILAFDLTSGEVVARRRPSPLLLWTASGLADTHQHHVLVAGERAVIFVAYARAGHSAVEKAAAPNLAIDDAASGCTTSLDAGASSTACFGGWHVLDAATLEPRGRIDYEPVRPDMVNTLPMLRAARYVPAADGSPAKLLGLVEDMTARTPWGGSTTGGLDKNPRQMGFNPTYLVQFDVDSGRQEWALRLEACRGAREGSDQGQIVSQRANPYPGALLRVWEPGSRAVFVGCFAPYQTGTVVRVPLDERGFPHALPIHQQLSTGAGAGGGPAPEPSAPHQTPGPVTVFGPERAASMLVDVKGRRILMKVVDNKAEAWWVFDATRMRFVGTIGIASGIQSDHSNTATVDEHGRLYVWAPPAPFSSFPGGLLVADVRRHPLPQALLFPQFAGAYNRGPSADEGGFVPFTREHQGRRLLYLHEQGTPALRILEDRVPSMRVSADEGAEPYAGRTLDLHEAAGVTTSVIDGAARGFGARAILIGGVVAASRVGPFDVFGNAVLASQLGNSAREANRLGKGELPEENGCAQNTRELVLGMVGPDFPMIVDASGSRAEAQPVVTDPGLRDDTAAPVSRCGGEDWDHLWSSALFGRAPTEEPGVPWVLGDQAAKCMTVDQESSDTVGGPLLERFHAATRCEGSEATASSYARGFEHGGVRVGEVLSSARIYRDPARGVVSRVESVTRGLAVDAVIRVHTVRGVAESWANGRRQPVPAQDRERGYDPNCDFERTAGTCFQRHLFGVWTPGYSCGPCGDEQRLLDGMNRALGAYGTVQFRSPHEDLAIGSENGFIAAVQKPDGERYADLTLNNDLLQTVLPTLELIRFTPPNRVVTGGGPRGRQVYQFAGVEVSSSYSIQCLLEYDEASNTCAPPAPQLGSLTVTLTDPGGVSLAGGGFEVREDVDGDGVVGLVDELLGDGACVTADDGVGSCVFDGLEPGSYLVSQTAAPAGYSVVAEPWVSEVAPGEARTVTFTNTSNVSTIEMSATDGDGNPVEGATFGVFGDPDADGKVAPDAQPVATCTTDAAGVCAMDVPAGSYVLVQTVAPAGTQPIEPVAFAFSSGGQTAAVGVVNKPVDDSASAVGPPPEPVRVDYTPPVGSAPSERVVDYTPGTIAEPRVSVPDRVGGTVVRVIRAPGDALRLLSRDPKQAVAWTASLVLFGLAVLAVRRRALLGTLNALPLAAFSGADAAPPPRPGASRPPAPGAPAHSAGGASSRTASALLERPVAGAAPPRPDPAAIDVVAVTAFSARGSVLAERLQADPRLRLSVLAGSLEELRPVLVQRRPDVLVADFALPTGGADDACDLLPTLHPPARTVGLIPTSELLQPLAVRGHLAGFGALLVADEDLGNGQLAYAVRCVAAGKLCYGPSVQAVLLGDRRDSRAGLPWLPAGLSPRELEVARLVAGGLSRKQVAQRLFLSEATVKLHVRAARTKLGATNPPDREHLRRRLVEFGLLDERAGGA